MNFEYGSGLIYRAKVRDTAREKSFSCTRPLTSLNCPYNKNSADPALSKETRKNSCRLAPTTTEAMSRDPPPQHLLGVSTFQTFVLLRGDGGSS